MSESSNSLTLRGWQWILVIAVAVLSGAIGGYFGGGVKIYVNENNPAFFGGELGATESDSGTPERLFHE